MLFFPKQNQKQPKTKQTKKQNQTIPSPKTPQNKKKPPKTLTQKLIKKYSHKSAFDSTETAYLRVRKKIQS